MYDLLIIGGGINGVGIARDAAGRGLKVALVEKDDLASHTSASSTKLIHGGLRYLEHYDFALVRKALIEREVLLTAAPHIIWPMRFVLPHRPDLRPKWLIRLGLFLYDHLGGRKILPPTRIVRGRSDPRLSPLKAAYGFGFEYSDCWVEDARLVVLNAVDAAERGADIFTRTACTGLARAGDHWTVQLASWDGGERMLTTRMVINAAGAFVDDVLRQAHPGRNDTHLRLVKGSHIITRKLYEGDHAYFFQNGDGRIIFAIPYEDGAYTLIGTTDVPYYDDRDGVKITAEETHYLCAAASEYFEIPVTPDDIVSTYSGVRPLYDDHSENASKVTRDYVLQVDHEGGAPILSVFGGKITTFRKLAEHALNEVDRALGRSTQSWTAKAPLPGGDLPGADFEAFYSDLVARYAGFPAVFLRRLARAYGTRVERLLGDAETPKGLGRDFGGGLYEAEVRYLMEVEFAQTAEDILMRRSKLGLHMPVETQLALRAWLNTLPARA